MIVGSIGIGITGTGSTTAPILAYGQIPGGQNAATGSSADTVSVTVTFEAQRPRQQFVVPIEVQVIFVLGLGSRQNKSAFIHMADL